MTPEYLADTYLPAMAAGLEAKRFFLPHVNKGTTRYIDFGCGDGQLLKAAGDRSIYRHPVLIGIDHATPKHLVVPEVHYVTGGPEVLAKAWLRDRPTETTLILSSVLHEVAYLRHLPISSLAPRYIAIRDMCGSLDNKGLAVSQSSREKLRALGSAAQWQSFTESWGSPCKDWHNATHWALKAPYAKNWEHENREDYLWITQGKLLAWLDRAGYRLIHCRRFTPPAVLDRLREYDLQLPNETHIELVVEARCPPPS